MHKKPNTTHGPRQVGFGVAEKLRAELARLSKSNEPRVQAFVRAMAERHPELAR
jgi:hypothetical protein